MLAEGVLGIIILLFGAELFVRGAVATARLLRWSPLVIGVTVVAIGTSLPELTISFFSASQGDYGLALGNLVGSNVANSLLVLGVGILAGSIRIGTTKTPKNAFIMLCAAIFYWYWHAIGGGNRMVFAYIALLGAVVFTTLEMYWAWWGKSHEDEHLSAREARADKKWILAMPISAYMITAGGNLAVATIENLSATMGVSTTFFGLILPFVATSLPELATTFVGLSKKEEKLVIGNIIGSNIYNLLLIGGIVGLWGNGAKLNWLTWTMFLLSAITVFLIVMVYKGKHIPNRIVGWLGMILAVYLFSIF